MLVHSEDVKVFIDMNKVERSEEEERAIRRERKAIEYNLGIPGPVSSASNHSVPLHLALLCFVIETTIYATHTENKGERNTSQARFGSALIPHPARERTLSNSPNLLP